MAIGGVINHLWVGDPDALTQPPSIREKKMIGYTYKTVVKDKRGIKFYYIGAHRVKVFDPCYIGSGKVLHAKLNSGELTHVKTKLLKWAESREELAALERESISRYKKTYLDRCLNVAKGGQGLTITFGSRLFTNGDVSIYLPTGSRAPRGFYLKRTRWVNNGQYEVKVDCDLSPPTGYTEGRLPFTVAHKKALANRELPPLSEKAKKKISKANKGRPAHNKGVPHSQEHCDAISEAQKGKAYTKGYVHINNGLTETLVPAGSRIPKGFVKGRLPFSEEHLEKIRAQSAAKSKRFKGRISPTKGLKWITNGKKQRQYNPLTEKIPKGWRIGRMPFSEEHKAACRTSSAGSKWINNGKQQRTYDPTTKLPKGWKLGRLPGNKNLVSTK